MTPLAPAPAPKEGIDGRIVHVRLLARGVHDMEVAVGNLRTEVGALLDRQGIGQDARRAILDGGLGLGCEIRSFDRGDTVLLQITSDAPPQIQAVFADRRNGAGWREGPGC